MKYYAQNGIKIIECSPAEVSIVMVDKTKKNITTPSTYVNLGFFGGFRENGKYFTLPVGNVVCDFATTNAATKKYCAERGTIIDGKFRFDSYDFASPAYNQFKGKPTDVFAIKNNKPVIERIIHTNADYSYCCTGVLVMRNGVATDYEKDVAACGWDSSTLYATYHIFVGLKAGSDKIYVMSFKTNTSNLITSKEAYSKLRALGITDAIKFDGGGSEIMRVNGAIKHATLENRQINTILAITPQNDEAENPYPVPRRTLVRGCVGDDVRWLQWLLVKLGFDPKGIDGSFGGGCYTAVKAYQKSRGLAVDGSVGPATRAKLLEE